MIGEGIAKGGGEGGKEGKEQILAENDQPRIFAPQDPKDAENIINRPQRAPQQNRPEKGDRLIGKVGFH